LIKAKGYTILSASCSIPCFELGGLCGSLAAGWISDVIFKARRSPVSLLYSFCTIAAVFCFYFTPAQWIYLNYASLFLVGFCVFGPQMLIGMAAAEVVEKKAAATANGFVGWCSYLGAATAGYPIAKVTEYFGWEGFFLTLAACGALTVLLLLPLWHIKTHPKLATPAAS
jgi:OPA family sugar phosphate sensor protein UhpC-like MFS transporter